MRNESDMAKDLDLALSSPYHLYYTTLGRLLHFSSELDSIKKVYYFSMLRKKTRDQILLAFRQNNG